MKLQDHPLLFSDELSTKNLFLLEESLPESFEGTAKVTIGSNINILDVGQSVYIPLKAKHRLENPGKIPTVIIEVQTGNYFGEDDIIRYEDIYSRD